MIDPLSALRAACIAVADGEAGEIELEWRTSRDDAVDQPGVEETLTIVVRREVKPFHVGMEPRITGN